MASTRQTISNAPKPTMNAAAGMRRWGCVSESVVLTCVLMMHTMLVHPLVRAGMRDVDLGGEVFPVLVDKKGALHAHPRIHRGYPGEDRH